MYFGIVGTKGAEPRGLFEETRVVLVCPVLYTGLVISDGRGIQIFTYVNVSIQQYEKYWISSQVIQLPAYIKIQRYYQQSVL